MLLFNIVIIFKALFLISLNIKKHKNQIFKNREATYTSYLVVLGWIILILSLFLFVDIYSLGIGITYWLGIITLDTFFLAVMYGRIK